MAQAFITTYNYYFRVHEFDLRKPLKPFDKIAEKLPEGDMWIVHKPLAEFADSQDLKEIEGMISQLVKDRYLTNYQVEYCNAKKPPVKETDIKEPEVNALLEYCRKLYGPKNKKILPPLATSKRLFGYMKPELMYTRDTSYQLQHGKPGYQILEENYSKILSKKPLKEICLEMKKS